MLHGSVIVCILSINRLECLLGCVLYFLSGSRVRSLSGELMRTLDTELSRLNKITITEFGRDPGKRYCARLYHSSSGIHSWDVYFAIVSDTDSHIAVSILCFVSSTS